MFPKDAHFICRRCLSTIIFKDDDFKTIEMSGRIQCPECGLKTPENSDQVTAFFKYYPRLVNAIPAMATNGFKPHCFTVEEVRTEQYTGHYIMPDLVSFCRECSEYALFKLQETKDPVRDFKCSSCGTRPRSRKYTKEFFECFEQVHDAQFRIFEFQFDLFGQANLDPSDFRIQHHFYRKSDD